MSSVEPYLNTVDVWLLSIMALPVLSILNMAISTPVLFNKLGALLVLVMDELKKFPVVFPVCESLWKVPSICL